MSVPLILTILEYTRNKWECFRVRFEEKWTGGELFFKIIYCIYYGEVKFSVRGNWYSQGPFFFGLSAVRDVLTVNKVWQSLTGSTGFLCSVSYVVSLNQLFFYSDTDANRVLYS